jgi:hypothetical protein
MIVIAAEELELLSEGEDTMMTVMMKSLLLLVGSLVDAAHAKLMMMSLNLLEIQTALYLFL